jgi:hypothetical protein
MRLSYSVYHFNSPLGILDLLALALVSRKFLQVIASWLLASLATYALASVFHSSTNLARLSALGFSIPMQDRLSMTVYDLQGLTAYFFVIAVGFQVAFGVFALVGRWRSFRKWLFYGVAGVLAMGTILLTMKSVFSMTPIAGARGAMGFALQLVAGGVGGAVFGVCIPKPHGSIRS